MFAKENYCASENIKETLLRPCLKKTWAWLLCAQLILKQMVGTFSGEN
jgi:hypothetical protein